MLVASGALTAHSLWAPSPMGPRGQGVRSTLPGHREALRTEGSVAHTSYSHGPGPEWRPGLGWLVWQASLAWDSRAGRISCRELGRLSGPSRQLSIVGS